MNIVIKELTNDKVEIDKVKKFLFRQIKLEFGYDYVPEWHQDIVDIGDYYINPSKNNFFVAYDNDEIIGTIGIRGYDKDFPEFRGIYCKENTSSIWRLFVDKRYRRKGLGSKLFGVAENFANEVSYKNIYLHTHRTLNGAIDFWTRMGFIITVDTNDELATVHMDKKINGIEITSPKTSVYSVDLF